MTRGSVKEKVEDIKMLDIAIYFQTISGRLPEIYLNYISFHTMLSEDG